MFRGRPHREDYPRHYAPRGPPGSSPPPHGPYRDDRERDRHYFVPDYHREPAYRRSPPGRRYPSPGREHNRGPMSEFRGSGPPPRDHPPGRRPSPLAPHGSIPIDHSLVITVGNELTLADHRAGVGADPRRVDPRKGPPEHLYDREETDEEYLRALASKGRYPGQDLDVDFHGGSLLFPPRREENSGIVSKEREGYTKPPYDPKDAKRPGYEVDPEGRGYRHMERPPESRRRSCSRGRSRSKARSPSRGKSRGRSPSRGKSRGRSRSTSQGKSRGRSPSRGKSRGRSRSRGKSRGRSRGRSRSHSRSRSRSRGKSSHRRSRSKSRAKSRGRSKSRTRGKSRSRSSSGSNRGRGRGRGGPPDAFDSKTSEGFRELELARRRKEQEELERMEYEISQRGAPGNVAGSVPAPHQSEEVAQMPKKSILKKRIEPEIDQQSIQSDECFSESSLDQRNSILSKETERFLNTLNKGIDSGLFSSLLREAREEGYGQMIQKQMSKSSSSYEEQFEEPYNRVKQEKPVESFGEFLLPHERVSQDGSGFSRILGMMSEFSNPADRKKGYADIEDEEKFLYGENEDEREPAPTPSQSVAAVPRQPSQPNIGQYRESRSGIADCRLSQPGMSLQQHSKNVASLNLLGKAGSGDHLEERSVSSPRQQNQPSLMHRQQSQPLPASEKEAKMGIPHRQLSQPEKVHHQQSQPGSYPPGPHQKSPQEEAAETQDSQEFEKIHDLLKTIGLDIGMAEISKLAARTQERLHGKKPQARSSRYTDRQRDGQGAASGTWDKQRSRSGSSHAKSPDSEYSRSISPPPAMRSSLNEPPSMHRKSEFQLQGDEKKSWGIPVLGDSASQPAVSMPSATMSPTTPQPIPVPANSVHALPGYAQYQPQPPPTPSYPPPGYDQYGNYMSYVPSGWPMYPPAQSHSVPPPQEDHQLPSSHSYLRVIETVNVGKGTTQPLQEESALVHVPVLDNVDTSNRVMLVGSTHQQRVSEEKNNADQKQKVIEEREKLKKERDARMKKKEYLMKELERLRKQQGELLRKKRREKDGHKDPLLVEVSRLQEEVMVQISLIRKEHEAAEKKRSELDKVALILGLHGSDKHRKEPKDSREFQPEKRREKPRSPEKSPVSSSNTTSKESSSSKPAPEKPKSKSPNRSQSPPTSADRYEYYDAGNHWCKNCNTICGSMFDFFTHMHSKTHRKTQDPYDRPWAPKTSNMNSILRTGDKIVLPSKGSEFLIPVIGFYCQLCEEFYGDQICAEDHVTCHIHNVKYKKYIEENPLYEQRRNLDRQAGLAAVMDNKERKRTELKRKMEEEPKTPKEEDRKQKVVMTEEVEEPSSPRELVEKASKHSRGHSSPKPLALPKVKKKPEEPAKPASPAASFGKFSWKKVDKEEEMPGEAPVELEEIGDESKDKDKEEGKAPLAKPKTIEIKLSGKTMIPPSTAWDRFNSMAKIRPNLPVPSMLLRKTNTAPVHKPAPLNTFLSIRPAGSSSSTKPLPIVKNEPKKDVMLTPDLISKAFGGEEVVLKIPALPDKNTPVMPDITTHPVEDVKNPAVAEMETATVANINADYIPKPPSPVMHLMSFESDVAAPGVPESEQTLHVLVRPPPLHKGLRESGLKNEKPKSSLAAAKAQDLYDIFYSTNSRGATDIKCGSIEGAGTKESKSEIGGAKLETQNVGVGVSKILSEAQEQESKMDSSGCGDIRDSGPCDSKVEGNKGETGIQSRESDIPVSEAVSKQEEMGTQNSVECSHSVQSTTDVLKDQTQSVEIISVQGGSDQATGSVAISDSQPCMESIESEHTLRGSDPAIHGDERTKTETCQKQPDSGSEAQSCDTDTAVVSTRKAFEGTDRSNVESLSLATEVPTDTLHGHKHLDPLETRNLMSSDTSLCSPDVNCKDDKNKNHEEVFLEIPDLPESLDLTAPMDEAEPLKVGLVESVMPVDLGGFGNPALSFETADLNLESYDFGFETADLTVPEPDAETVTAEVPGTTNHEETVVIQMHNSGGELCSSGLEEELHILDSVKPDDKETEMHDMAGTLMLEDIGEVVGSFPLESDAVAVASAQLDESSEMRDANPAELWESEKENPSEIKEQSAHQSCQSKDEEHPMEVSLEESSPNDEN